MKVVKHPTVRILIALVLGLLVGLIYKEKAAVLQPIGDIFLSLIKMLVIPLVMCSIINSTSNMRDMKVLGRVGGKTLGLYVLTTAAATAIGIFFATIARVGEGVSIVETAEVVSAAPPTILGTLRGMVSSNIFSSMANFETLPCIIFSILFGVAITILGEKGEPTKRVIASAAEVLYTLVGIVVKIAPLGIFALIVFFIVI